MSGGNASPSCCRLHRCDRLSLHSLGAANVNSEVRLDWMSALGQKQTCALQNAMSALPPIATAKADTKSLAPTSTLRVVTPVILPPGRFKLETKPICTGSLVVVKTIGMVAVAAFAARAAGVEKATIRDT